MTDEELVHLRSLRAETNKRLHALELQAARYGPNRVPAEITIEVQAAREEIERIDAKLRAPTISPAVQAATGPEAYIDVLRARVDRLADQVYEALRWTTDQILEMREETREWRAYQDSERAKGVRERRLIEVLLFIGLMVAIYLAVQ